MSIFEFLFGGNKKYDNDIAPTKRDTNNYAFVDVEVGLKDHKVHDIGALRHDGAVFHNVSKDALIAFLHDIDYVCGQSIFLTAYTMLK